METVHEVSNPQQAIAVGNDNLGERLQIYFRGKEDLQETQFTLYDMNGKAHLSKRITQGGNLQVHQNLPSGMYIFLIQNTSGKIVDRGKVVIVD